MMKLLRFILNVLPVIGILWTSAVGSAWCAGLPKKGDTLPAFELQAPASEKAREYLGISQASFRLGDIPCRLLLFEVIGVYCPQCYRQAPLFNTLFNRIEKDPNGKVLHTHMGIVEDLDAFLKLINDLVR